MLYIYITYIYIRFKHKYIIIYDINIKYIIIYVIYIHIYVLKAITFLLNIIYKDLLWDDT